MPDIIQILPDSVANQIAAGEVIQRPASVVKELVENSVDAGSTFIQVIIKDAGRTLIQVIDNGKGMSETDARLSFERHATSKIRKADDLFSITTKGFRGEALASIAAVANVELRTRRQNDELGSFIYITDSQVIRQEAVNCPVGSNFSVFNLFFNVPARRKFLKSNSAEIRHIINEFQRISLAHPDVAFVLYHNNEEVYNLPVSNYRQRIINLMGKHLNQSLTPIKSETNILKILGYIGKPEHAKKASGEQFFFVNNRFIKQPYFHKAVMLAYDQILPKDELPSYFIYFEIDPKLIDVNIHPTKTEINFEDGNAVFQLLRVTIREALGKFGIVPSIDFNIKELLPFSINAKNAEVKNPEVNFNPEYNPFESEHTDVENYSKNQSTAKEKSVLKNWEKLYADFEKEDTLGKTDQLEGMSDKSEKQVKIAAFEQQQNQKILQFKNKYIFTPVKSGLMMINQKRAHERIIYESFLADMKNDIADIQKTLYPAILELSPEDFSILHEIRNDLRKCGFDIDVFGKNSFVINGTPATIEVSDPKALIESMLVNLKQNKTDIKTELREKIAISLAKSAAINYGKPLSCDEMRNIIDNLFACQNHNFSPDGKKIISILTIEDIDKHF